MPPLIIIPARLASTRLPNKPLARIGDRSMIEHVWRLAKDWVEEVGKGEVIVACDSNAIADVITQAGGCAIPTDPNLPSGSDRSFAALQLFDPDPTYDIIVNLQGDMPTLAPHLIGEAVSLLADPQVEIATLATRIQDPREMHDPAVVKPIIAFDASGTRGRGLYFTRATAPSGDGPLYHHIGLYAYRRAALEKFVSLPPSPLEKREKLEQLRAIEAGMRIDIGIVDTMPLGVDTEETLELARKWYHAKYTTN